MKNKKTKYLRGAVLAMLLCGAFPSGVEGASKSIGVGIWNESFEIGYDDAQFTISTSPYYTLHISVNTAAVSSSSSSLVTGAQVYSYVTQAIADAGTGGGTSIVDYDTNYSTSNDHYLATKFGDTTWTPGSDSAAYGYNAKATGLRAQAFGTNATASESYANAYGREASATAKYSNAYGFQAIANAYQSSAYGYNAQAQGESSGAYGHTATATAFAAGAYGNNAKARGTYAGAYGAFAAANTNYSLALGSFATVGNKSTTTSDGVGGIAIGSEATVNITDDKGGTSEVKYEAPNVTGDLAIAIGAGTSATKLDAVAIGVTSSATGQRAISFGAAAKSSGDNATALGNAAIASANYAGAYGYQAKASGVNAGAYGMQTVASGLNAGAYGSYAKAYTNYSLALGTYATVGQSETATTTNGVGGIAIGSYGGSAETLYPAVYADYGIAIGTNARVLAGATYSTAVGYGAKTSTTQATALGYNATANQTSSVALGAGSVTTEANSVSVGASTDSTRTITNVTAGDSTKDAANWDQIAATGKTVTLSTATRETLGTNNVQHNQIASNDGTVLATFTPMAAVSSGDNGFVSGAHLYAENRADITGTSIVRSTATAGANLKALEQHLVKKMTYQVQDGTVTVYNNQYSGTGDATEAMVAFKLTGLDGDSSPVITDGKTETETDHWVDLAMNGAADDASVTRGSNSAAYGYQANAAADNSTALGYNAKANVEGSVALGSASVVAEGEGNVVSVGSTKDNITRKIINVANGSQNTDAATYGQIVKAGQTFTLKSDKATANIMANDDKTSLANITIGTGAIASTDTGFVDGKTVYEYDKPVAKTGYVLTNVNETASTGVNLGTLDAAIVDQQRLIKANDEKTQISIGNDTTFANVTAVDIGNGSARTLTGVKAGTETTDAANFGQLANGKNGTPYTMDENGIITVSTNAGGDAFKIQISGNGSIASGNTQLITGGTAYAYLNPTTGSYVTSGATTAANLNALDNAIGTVSAGNYLVASGVTTGNNIAANLEKLDTAIGKTAAGHYIAAQDGSTTTVATNLKVLDDALYEHAKLVKADNAVATSATKILVGSDAGFDNVSAISVFKADGTTTRKIEGVSTGTETTDAATFGQILKKQVVTISQNNNTAYLYDHDENKVVEIVVEGLGEHGKSTSIVDFSTDAHWLSTDFDKQFDMKGTNSTAYGYGANAQGRASMALGKDAVAFAEEAVAIGAESTANAAVVTAEDGTKTATVSFGHKKDDFTGWYYKTVNGVTTYSVEQEEGFEAYNYAEDKLSRLTNIAAGDADTDAVNVSQLKQAISDSAYRASDTITIDADRTIRATYMAVGDSVHLGLPKATGTDAMAVGIASQADGLYATALGVNSAAIGEQAVSVGLNNTVEARKATALGRDNQAKGDVSVALGNFNQSMGTSSTAVGVSNDVGTFGDGKQSTAVGYYNTVYGTQSTGVGYKNYIEANLSAGFGSQNTVYGGQSTAVGYNNKIGATTEADSTVVDTTKGNHTYVFGENNAVTANNALVFGSNVATVADRSVVIGDGSTSEDPNTVSVGSAALQRKIVHVADGSVNTDAATYGQLVKNQEYTFDANGVATIETNASTKENPQTAFILKLAASGSIDAGSGGYVTGAALYTELRPTSGKYVSAGKTTAENFVALDTQVKSNADTIDTINTDVSGLKTDVSGMKTDISGLKTDVSTLDTRVTTIESSIGDISGKIDGTKVDGSDIVLSKTNNTATVNHADGSKAFSITIEGLGEGISPYVQGDGIEISDDNKISVKVGDDLTVNENGISVKKEGTVTSGSTGLVTGGAVYNAIEEKTGDMSKLKSAGLSDNLVDSVLTVNEKAAGIAADIGDTSKLAAAGIGDNLTDSVLTVNDKIGSLSDDINKVGAGAAALAALRPEGFDPGDKWSFAVGYGHYKNANAGALGAFFKPNADTTVSLGGTIGNGDSMMNMGVSFKLGARSKNAGVYRNAVELVQRVDGLESDIARETRRNDNQEALIAAQAQEIRALKAQVAVLMKRAGLTVSVEKAVTR